jgi:hypothetical protein
MRLPASPESAEQPSQRAAATATLPLGGVLSGKGWCPPRGAHTMKRFLASAVFLALACHCGSSSGSGGGGDVVNDGGTPSGDVLTVNNYLSWCVVTVDGNAMTAQTQTYNVDAGTVVSLDAHAAVGFMWGYWIGTAGANAGDGNHDPSMATTVTVTSANANVRACCPSNVETCPF